MARKKKDTPGKAGPKTKFDFTDSQNLLRIEGWARDGLDDKDIAKNTGYNETYFCELKSKYPELADAIKKGRAPLEVIVESKLLRRALGMKIEVEQAFKCKRVWFDENGNRNEEEEIKTIILNQEIPPDTTAQIFWLKSKKPKIWNVQPIRIDATTNGNDISNKELVFLSAEALSADQIEKILGDEKPRTDD